MTTLITNSQFKQFDANGKPLAAGQISTKIVGTTTDKLTYQDEALTVPHTNPITLDAWGEATIWIDGDTKLIVSDSDAVYLRTYESYADAITTNEFPVVSSPQGAVYRSQNTDVGYIKIQLPMGEWPNTKMMFDVMIYTDAGDEAFTLTLGGFADSSTSAWLTTTAITNGITDYTVQFGNDGTYPAIYIGAVGTNWVKPQVAVTNFLAGEFSYDWATWDNGWAISVTTSLGTITSTETALAIKVPISDSITAVDSKVGWVAWQTDTDWTYSASTFKGTCAYRKSNDGALMQVHINAYLDSGSDTYTPYVLPVGYRPLKGQNFVNRFIDTGVEGVSHIEVQASGAILYTELIDSNAIFYFDGIISLDLDY